MNILVTGAKGFIGKNLVVELRNQGFKNIYEYDIDTNPELLDEYAQKCDFILHLAGVNRPENPEDFIKGNFGFTSDLLGLLKKYSNKAPILVTSSTQASLENPYGKSKKAGEELIFSYGVEQDVAVYVYRLPNVFGKWCRPNYNSAVATFCHNIANNLPIQVNNPDVDISLVYIDDVVHSFINKLKNGASEINSHKHFENIAPIYSVRLKEIVSLLHQFKESRTNLSVPNMEDLFTKKLYSTYLSYLPTDKFNYFLNMNIDNRGSFTEFLKNSDRGQVSINISKPGIIKGNHWHHTKNEKFLVVSGKGVIRFRRIDSGEIIEYYVSGNQLEVIDIPVGYTHNIENIGKNDMVTIMWANEIFNKESPDTMSLEV